MEFDQVKIHKPVKARLLNWAKINGHKFSEAITKLLDIAEKKKN